MSAISIRWLFGRAYYGVSILSLLYGMYLLRLEPGLGALALILIAAVPLWQAVKPFDRKVVPHHKVRLPIVSFCVFAGVATLLLSEPPESSTLVLGFINLGGFLLHTYWADAET